MNRKYIRKLVLQEFRNRLVEQEKKEKNKQKSFPNIEAAQQAKEELEKNAALLGEVRLVESFHLFETRFEVAGSFERNPHARHGKVQRGSILGSRNLTAFGGVFGNFLVRDPFETRVFESGMAKNVALADFVGRKSGRMRDVLDDSLDGRRRLDLTGTANGASWRLVRQHHL